MQNFAEHKPRGVAKSCPTYRAAGQNEIASGGTHHDSLRQRDNPGPDLVKISIREMENEYSSTADDMKGQSSPGKIRGLGGGQAGVQDFSQDK